MGISEEKLIEKESHIPQTIVISSEARVLQNWPGAYVSVQKSRVEAFLHVTLPEVKAGL